MLSLIGRNPSLWISAVSAVLFLAGAGYGAQQLHLILAHVLDAVAIAGPP